MILFPPAKINLGLQILRKRDDGYHEIATCMVPFPLFDIIEILPAADFSFRSSGLVVDGDVDSNLCVKAFQLLKNRHQISNVYMHLRKQIPMGAGLGGGSSDAAYVLKGLNGLFALNLSLEQLESYAAELGSDCPFFIRNEAQIARGRGEVLSPINLTLKGKFLLVLNPQIHVGTKEAYAGVVPNENQVNLLELLALPLNEWQSKVINDFEEGIFQNHPLIGQLKEELIALGAEYAAMSGSGSSVFGIFKEPIELPESHPMKKFEVFCGAV